MNQALATVLGSAITGAVALTVGVLAYIFGRIQKEHEVRFTRIYQRRDDVVAELYESLNKIQGALKKWYDYDRFRLKEEREETFLSLREDLNDFANRYLAKSIWITDGTRKKLDAFHSRVDGVWSKIATIDTSREAKVEVKSQLSELHALGEELRKEFKEVLGISESKRETEESPVLGGKKRVAIGVGGTALIGVGLGGVLSLLGVSDTWPLLLLTGLCIGVGLGLLLEYLRPTRDRGDTEAPSSSRR